MVETINDITLANAILRTLCAINAFGIFIFSMSRKNQMPIFKQLSAFALAFGFWDLIMGIMYFSPNVQSYEFLNSLSYLGVAFSSYTYFMFVVCFYKDMDAPNSWFALLIAIIPTITCILSLTHTYNPYFINYLGGFSFAPIKVLNQIHGPWFYVHSVYSYLLIVASCILLLKKLSKRGLRNRKAFIALAIVTFILCIENIVTTFIVKVNVGFPVVILHFCSLNTFLLSVCLDQESQIKYLGELQFSEGGDFPYFMFNNKDELISINKSAKQLLEKFEKPANLYQFYRDIFPENNYSYLGKVFYQGEMECYYLQSTGDGEIFYCRKTPIIKRGNKKIGYALSVNNIQVLNTLISDLEQFAYYDQLCVCKSRVLFEHSRVELIKDAAENQSFFVVCDVDSLKRVNDTFGHTQGDNYIADCSQLLRWEFNEIGDLYRIGGDEFFVHVKGVDAQEMKEIVKRIQQESFDLEKGLSTGISIGWVQVESEIGNSDEQWDAIFKKYFDIADKKMYQDKHDRKCERVIT